MIIKRKFLSLFGLTLAVFILLGTMRPLRSQIISQSPQTTTVGLDNCFVPDVLCKQIKNQAKTDVEAEEKKRTEYVIKRFTALHPAWKDKLSAPEIAKLELEIANTYEQEYNIQDGGRKRDPQVVIKKAFENGIFVPLLVSFLAIIVAWFRNTIGNMISLFIHKFDNWVYNRFAGTPIFAHLALQRYREALVENNKHLKLSFRVNQKPLKLKMSEIYVPLKVAGTSDSDQVDAYQAIAQHRRLMVTGDPGSGKTMLLKHIVFSYGNGRLTGLENRPVPVLVDLHRLNDKNLTEEKLIEAIVEAFKLNRFPNSERFVRHGLGHGKLMLLLDGLDEVSSEVRPVLVQRVSDLLRSFDEHQRCRLVVTCRKAVYDQEFAHETEQVLEVVEF